MKGGDLMTRMKFLSIMLLAIILLLFAAGCSPSAEVPMSLDDETAGETSEMNEKIFTVEEVASFNGKNGQKAYVIYDGYVYDVTGHPQWQSGSHGGNAAGTDITGNLKDVAPHGISKLGEAERIGKIAE